MCVYCKVIDYCFGFNCNIREWRLKGKKRLKAKKKEKKKIEDTGSAVSALLSST